MTNEVTLLQILIRPDGWFVGSLFRWGLFSLIASVAVVATLAAALAVRDSKKALNCFLLAWTLVVVLVCFRANHQLHSIGDSVQSVRLVNSTYVLRLMLDALILPGLATGLLLIKWNRQLISIMGRWQLTVLVLLVLVLTAASYILVRLSDWLTGSVGLIGIH
jgi:hypothetical protein